MVYLPFTYSIQGEVYRYVDVQIRHITKQWFWSWFDILKQDLSMHLFESDFLEFFLCGVPFRLLYYIVCGRTGTGGICRPQVCRESPLPVLHIAHKNKINIIKKRKLGWNFLYAISYFDYFYEGTLSVDGFGMQRSSLCNERGTQQVNFDCTFGNDLWQYLLTLLQLPPYRCWRRSEGRLLLHSFLSLDKFVAFSILNFGTSA